MKYIALISLLVLAACSAPDPDKIVGRWKLEKAWDTKKDPEFPASHFINLFKSRNFYMYLDGKKTGYITPQGDTIKPMPYEFRNDSLAIKTTGFDVLYSVAFNTSDTLQLTDKNGMVIQYSRVKSTEK